MTPAEHLRAARKLRALILGAAFASAIVLSGCQHVMTESERYMAEYRTLRFSWEMNIESFYCNGLDADGSGHVACYLRDRATGAETPIIYPYAPCPANCEAQS